MAINIRAARLTIIALALVLASTTVPSQVRDTAVGAISGEMIVKSPDNRTIGKLEGTVSYSLPAQAGDAKIRFTPSDPATTVSASAEFTAVRQEEAFGAVSALMLALAGRMGNDRTSLRLSNIRVDGDPRALRPYVDAIIGWWDEQAGMAVSGYLSPVLSITHIGKLILNVWGIESSGHSLPMHGYAVIMFDPANPGVIVGGRIMRRIQDGDFTFIDLPHVAGGQLTAMIETPTPNDYLLTIGTPPDGGNSRAELLIEMLPDGTFDVRGAATRWVLHPGVFSVEGIGTAKFVPPGS